MVESTKLAMADREAWYGDPDYAPDVIDDLLKVDYVDQRRELIGETASWEVRPGAPQWARAASADAGRTTGRGLDWVLGRLP